VQNFTKFRPGKYDFDLYTKGFSMGKMAQIRQISKRKKVSKTSNFYDKFPAGRQECRRILVFNFNFFFLLCYLVYSQIWLNHHLMDDHHFSYITK